jgi:hypothetical protein
VVAGRVVDVTKDDDVVVAAAWFFVLLEHAALRSTSPTHVAAQRRMCLYVTPAIGISCPIRCALGENGSSYGASLGWHADVGSSALHTFVGGCDGLQQGASVGGGNSLTTGTVGCGAGGGVCAGAVARGVPLGCELA